LDISDAAMIDDEETSDVNDERDQRDYSQYPPNVQRCLRKWSHCFESHPMYCPQQFITCIATH